MITGTWIVNVNVSLESRSKSNKKKTRDSWRSCYAFLILGSTGAKAGDPSEDAA